LSSENDAFFKDNMFKSIGEIGAVVRRIAEAYVAKTNGSRTVSSIADMQRFVADYPDFHKMSKEITMHVSILTEISRVVEDTGLLQMSALEQELACGDDHEYAIRV